MSNGNEMKITKYLLVLDVNIEILRHFSQKNYICVLV